MTLLPSPLPGPTPRTIRSPVRVLVFVDHPPLEQLSSILSDDGFEVDTLSADPDSESEDESDFDFDFDLDRLDDTDCLIVSASVVGSDDDGNGDVLDRIRRHEPALPVVLLTDIATETDSEAGDEDAGVRGDGDTDVDTDTDADADAEATAWDGPRPAVIDVVRSQEWTAHLVVGRPEFEIATECERIGRRVRELVERRRLAALSSRSLASVELAQDAIAIVGPDDAIEFVNRWFALRFGYERTALPGRSWQDLFTDETVRRLESSAIPTVTDGWRWTGTCAGRRRSGETFSARIRLAGLEDGSLVIVVDDVDDVEDASADREADVGAERSGEPDARPDPVAETEASAEESDS